MTDHSCQWISPLISSRPAHHTLEPGSGCSPGTQSHVQAHLPFLHSSELFSGEVTYFKPPLTKLQYQPQDSITLFLAQHLLILYVLFCQHMTALKALRYLVFLYALGSLKGVT